MAQPLYRCAAAGSPTTNIAHEVSHSSLRSAVPITASCFEVEPRPETMTGHHWCSIIDLTSPSCRTPPCHQFQAQSLALSFTTPPTKLQIGTTTAWSPLVSLAIHGRQTIWCWQLGVKTPVCKAALPLLWLTSSYLGHQTPLALMHTPQDGCPSHVPPTTSESWQAHPLLLKHHPQWVQHPVFAYRHSYSTHPAVRIETSVQVLLMCRIYA